MVKVNKNIPDKEEFLKLYCTDNASIAEIAAHFGISRGTVFRLARYFCVKKTKEQLSDLKKRGCTKRDYETSLKKRIKTESELTDTLGWLKVYDSGKDVWVYKCIGRTS